MPSLAAQAVRVDATAVGLQGVQRRDAALAAGAAFSRPLSEDEMRRSSAASKACETQLWGPAQ